MTAKQLTASLSEAAGWLSTLGFTTMREHRRREAAIAAIETAVASMASATTRPAAIEPEPVDDSGDEAAAEAYADFQNLEQVKRAVESGALSAETAYALEEAGKSRRSYLAYFKSVMEESNGQ